MSSPLLRNTSFGPGLFDPSQNKKIKPKDPNPYQEGTPEYVNWEGANETYKSMN